MGQMTNYIMPTSADLPPIRVLFEEWECSRGLWRQGIGELPMDGPAPAIVNSIEDAARNSLRLCSTPAEDIFEAVGPAEKR